MMLVYKMSNRSGIETMTERVKRAKEQVEHMELLLKATKVLTILKDPTSVSDEQWKEMGLGETQRFVETNMDLYVMCKEASDKVREGKKDFQRQKKEENELFG